MAISPRSHTNSIVKTDAVEADIRMDKAGIYCHMTQRKYKSSPRYTSLISPLDLFQNYLGFCNVSHPPVDSIELLDGVLTQPEPINSGSWEANLDDAVGLFTQPGYDSDFSSGG